MVPHYYFHNVPIPPPLHASPSFLWIMGSSNVNYFFFVFSGFQFKVKWISQEAPSLSLRVWVHGWLVLLKYPVMFLLHLTHSDAVASVLLLLDPGGSIPHIERTRWGLMGSVDKQPSLNNWKNHIRKQNQIWVKKSGTFWISRHLSWTHLVGPTVSEDWTFISGQIKRSHSIRFKSNCSAFTVVDIVIEDASELVLFLFNFWNSAFR